MRGFKILIFLLGIALANVSCDNGSAVVKETDTPSSGHLNMLVDETFKPVIDEIVKVYMSNFPGVKIDVKFLPENEVIKEYMEGRAKLIITSRELSEKEVKYCYDRKIVPSSLLVAKDAVAVIVNKNSKDTTFTNMQLQKIIGDQSKDSITVVVDNEGSSTLRFIIDSIMKGTPLGKNIFKANGNNNVIEHVIKNPKAIGFVGLSFISDTMDSTSESFKTSIKVAAILNDSSLQYYQPYQVDIALKNYPYARKMYYIKNETYQGVASGVANFLAYDKGQLILGKKRLVPMRMSIVFREAAVNSN